MLFSLGAYVARRPRRFVVFHLVLLALAVPIVPDVLPRLKGGGFEDDDAESWQTKAMIERELGQGAADIIALYKAPAGSTIDDIEVLSEVLAASTRMEAFRLTESVDCLYTTGAPWLAAHDRKSTALIITLHGTEHDKQAALPEMKQILKADGMEVVFTGFVVVNHSVADLVAHDIIQGELYALPLTLLLLLWVFRSVVAALLPLLMGVCANLAAFSALRVLTIFTDVSIFAANIVTLLALGLAIDCSLFVVTRFREELKRGDGDVAECVSRSMGTAGRAVFFSGAVVALSMMALMAMPQMLIKSLGYAGVVVVLGTLWLMIFLLPAVLSLIGHNIESLPLPRFKSKSAMAGAPEEEDGAREGRFFHALARRVMKRPVVTVVVVGGFLLFLAAPFLKVVPSVPDYRALPHGDPAREATDFFNGAFLPNQLTPHDIVIRVQGDVFEKKNLEGLLALQRRMEKIPGIIAVQSVFTAQPNVSPATVIDLLSSQRAGLDPSLKLLLARFMNKNHARFVVLSNESANTQNTMGQVAALRALDDDAGGFDVKVGGAPSVLVDLLARLKERGPFALCLVGLAMFAVLFFAFHSLVVPLKAIVMNMLSMTASFGALVWVFQDGRFTGLLRYEPVGYTDATTPLIMFCLVFGLSMDYEVLLLGRIREEAATHGTEDAVAIGLQKTGRTITSAALLLMVVVGAFGLSQVLAMKQLGLGIALAVALDATIVRAVLVPATMKLLGHWNWWPGKIARPPTPSPSSKPSSSPSSPPSSPSSPAP